MTELSPIIHGLSASLLERGKIKIGAKGNIIRSAKGTEFQPPQRLDHFRVVTLERGPDGNFVRDDAIHRLYGDRPRELPVRLLYDDIYLNFQCRYTCFLGKTLWCYGDGMSALRLEDRSANRTKVECPCGRQEPTYTGQDRCKINSVLSVIIDGVETVGGVWKLRTTSYNSTVGILSSLALIKRLTGGVLAGIPLRLVLRPKTAINPTNGQSMLVWVVGMEYPGRIEELQHMAYEQAKRMAVHAARIEQIEAEARTLIAASQPVDPSDVDDVVDEFYPEQAQKVLTVSAEESRQAEPSTETQTEATDVKDGSSSKRVRRNRWDVDASVFGSDSIITCGATPDQLIRIRELSASDKDLQAMVKRRIHEITGYDQMSYLRHDEAISLINELLADQAQQQAPQDQDDQEQEMSHDDKDDAPKKRTVECPLRGGDTIYVDEWCLAGKCKRRNDDGWCPQVDDVPDDYHP